MDDKHDCKICKVMKHDMCTFIAYSHVKHCPCIECLVKPICNEPCLPREYVRILLLNKPRGL
jgi:hypothetical protein